MKLQEKDIKEIGRKFAKMKSKDELLDLLNFSKLCLYGDKAKTISMKQLNYHYNVAANKKRYIQFHVQKKNGGIRTICAPNKGLKEIQKCLNVIFNCLHEPHAAATGFVSGKSIVDNANRHVGNIYVYNIDLKDFFHSIDQARVWGRLHHPPFNLNKDKKRDSLANIIAALCCHEMEVERLSENGDFANLWKSVLPQGAPTSPILSNIICERLDHRLTGVAKRFGLKYSRYADDITFSSMHNVYQNGSHFIKEIVRIITDQRFVIKDAKTRLQKEAFRQEVTGLVVNQKVNVNKRYISQLRMWLYYWERYGYETAKAFFLKSYLKDKGHVKKGTPNIENVLSGKLEYLKMVKGEKNSVYLKLSERFKRLSSQKNPLNEVLLIWENQGIEKAMAHYYSNATLNVEHKTLSI